MSVRKNVWVNCDLCGDSTALDLEDCSTSAEARRGAASLGWVTRGTSDYCDACRDNPAVIRTKTQPEEATGAYSWFGHIGGKA